MAKRKATATANGTPTPAPPELPPLRLEWRSPAELTENPRNWRTHPEAQTKALADVVDTVGWAGACLYNETTGRLIDGHARRGMALAQGVATVPVLVGRWTEAQEATILATLDPLGAMAGADAAQLDALLRDVRGGEGAAPALAQMLADLGAAHPVPPPEPGAGGDEFDPTPADGPTRCQPGDLWAIGGVHRLLCGDATKAADVARLMGGERAGLCFTSPPYAQQRDYGDAAKEHLQDWHGLMCGAFGNLPMVDAGQVLVNLGLVHRDGEWVPYWDGWIEWMRSQGWRRFGWYVWDQGPGLPGDWNGRLAPAHEWVFHFNREPQRPAKMVPCIHAGEANHGRGLRRKDGTIDDYSHLGKDVQPFKIPDTVIRVMREKRSTGLQALTAAPFPVAFPSFVVECWPGDVFDPFMGSGTTLIAAHRLNRRCFGVEIEPRYCDVILRRAEAEGLTVERTE